MHTIYCEIAGAIRIQIGFVSIVVVLQRDTYRVLQTIQMQLLLLCFGADRAILGSAKTALKVKYEI